MINTKCAICEVNNFNVLYNENFNINEINKDTFSARRLPDKVHYKFVRCKKCGLVYANPRLESNLIEKLYKKSGYTYEEFEEDLIATYSKYFKKYINKQSKKGRLLEIGCGNGFFLSYLKNNGYKGVWGVEPGKDTVQKATDNIKKNIIVDIFKKNQFKRNYFDVIFLFQVFDHIPNPNELLTECYKILKKGGMVLCINHDVDSISAKILKDKSPIIDIEHTYLFNKKTLPRIFKKNKFKLVDVFNVVNRYPIYYWLRLFPIPIFLKSPLLKFIKENPVGKIKLWLPPGNIGIVAKK